MIRQVEVADSDGRIVAEALRFVVVHASPLAHQHTQTYASGQAKEAAALAAHVHHVQAQWCAWEADAEAAIAAYAHRGPGQRGRRPQAWRYHVVRDRVVADTRRTRRVRRGRPATTAPPPTEAGYRPYKGRFLEK